MGEKTIVQTVDLKKYFKVPQGLLHAVDGVNVRIDEGKTLGVVGESGCGKTTLGQVILRLIEPTSGQVLYEGNDILKLKKSEMYEMRRKMQVIFQDPYSSLNPRLSVIEIIAEPMIVNKTFKTRKGIFKRAAELMDTVGLASRLSSAYPHELDGGRRQRIGVARALSVNPKFIVCDEPVSALDVSIQAQILNLLMDLQVEYGLTFMFITHDLSVVKHISNDIMVMYLGKCVEQAPSRELFKNPVHPYTKALLSAIPVPHIKMRDKVIDILEGEVSSPINPGLGCRFAPRCVMVNKSCNISAPELKEISPGHFCACVHV